MYDRRSLKIRKRCVKNENHLLFYLIYFFNPLNYHIWASAKPFKAFRFICYRQIVPAPWFIKNTDHEDHCENYL